MSKLRIKGQVVVPFTLFVDGDGVAESDLRRSGLVFRLS